jgi:hypothetical protein
MSRLGKHLRCSKCLGRPDHIKVTHQMPNGPHWEPQNEKNRVLAVGRCEDEAWRGSGKLRIVTVWPCMATDHYTPRGKRRSTLLIQSLVGAPHHRIVRSPNHCGRPFISWVHGSTWINSSGKDTGSGN